MECTTFSTCELTYICTNFDPKGYAYVKRRVHENNCKIIGLDNNTAFTPKAKPISTSKQSSPGSK